MTGLWLSLRIRIAASQGFATIDLGLTESEVNGVKRKMCCLLVSPGKSAALQIIKLPSAEKTRKQLVSDRKNRSTSVFDGASCVTSEGAPLHSCLDIQQDSYSLAHLWGKSSRFTLTAAFSALSSSASSSAVQIVM